MESHHLEEAWGPRLVAGIHQEEFNQSRASNHSTLAVLSRSQYNLVLRSVLEELGTSKGGNMLGCEPSTRWPTLLSDTSLEELYVSTLSSAAGRASRYVG